MWSKRRVSFLAAVLFLNPLFVIAQATSTASSTSNTPYATQTIQTKADELCNKYTSSGNVFPVASAGGGGSVAVDLQQLRPVLESINRNTQLTANETRATNLLKFCEEYQNMARASAKLSNDAAKQLKTLADNCQTDQACLIKRIFDSDIAKEIEKVKSLAKYGREISQLILDIGEPEEEEETDFELLEYCNKAKANGRNPIECITAPTTEDVITQKYEEARNRIERNQNAIASEFARGNGIVATRQCTKTQSGVDPSLIKFYDADCTSYRTDPLIAAQENYRQIVALPYTQAFSPSSILGADQVIDNINTRVRQGNLSDPDISANFGSIQQGGANPITGGGTNGVSDLASVQANYNKLLGNLGTVINLYEVGKLAYASTTSVCKVLPVAQRSESISKIDAAKNTYVAYRTQFVDRFTAAQKTPKESHTQLIVDINFALKDKINQELIDKVYAAIKAYLQICVNAGSGATS